MPDALPSEALGWLARQRMRALARQLRVRPDDAQLHLERLQAAMDLPGSDPLQGCLADLFHAVTASRGQDLRQLASELAQARLPRHVSSVFQQLRQSGQMIGPISLVANRWSVMVQPSAAAPARSRRASGDDSRRLAEQVVRAMTGGDAADASAAVELLEYEFLAHCSACQDKLAFMLARRELLRQGLELTPAWLDVAAKLEGDAAGAASAS
ncbi:hypothetical protein [Corticibacter populi]|nr:hypothetical protein [Corticibacter populi]RZS30003.1 hypothetical protein EV687_3488 [Corticibacter populi]